jgi:hypothetical protein
LNIEHFFSSSFCRRRIANGSSLLFSAGKLVKAPNGGAEYPPSPPSTQKIAAARRWARDPALWTGDA